jgi:nucleotide-binding universal stress UspA family protein
MRVIWAIDAIGESALLLERAAEFLRRLVSRTSLEIEPVSVLEGIRQEAGIEDRLLSDEQALPGLKRSLDSLMLEFEDLREHLLPSVVLGGSSFSAAKRIAQYATSHNADLILCSTHARSGIQRLLLGSFVEELLKVAQTPVNIVRVRPIPEPNRTLYWTDFKDNSVQDFRKVVRACKQLGTTLSVFHCPQYPMEPILQSGTYLLSGAQPVLHRITSPRLFRLERRGLAWARWAEHQGVECEFILDERPGNPVVQFLELLQSKSIGIAFVSKPPRLREILRKAPCPVWVIR